MKKLIIWQIVIIAIVLAVFFIVLKNLDHVVEKEIPIAVVAASITIVVVSILIVIIMLVSLSVNSQKTEVFTDFVVTFCSTASVSALVVAGYAIVTAVTAVTVKLLVVMTIVVIAYTFQSLADSVANKLGISRGKVMVAYYLQSAVILAVMCSTLSRT